MAEDPAAATALAAPDSARPSASGVAAAAEPPLRVPPMLVTLAGITWRVLLIGLAFYLLLIVIDAIFPVAIAIFLAMFTTALAGPIARLFTKVMPKALAVVLSLLIIVVVGTYLLVQVIGSIISQGPALAEAISAGFNEIQEWLAKGPLQLSSDQIGSLQQQGASLLESLGSAAVSDLVAQLGTIGTIIVAGSVYLFGTLFFMNSGDKIWQWAVSWTPERARAGVDVCGHLAWHTLAGYTRGVVLVAICDALLVFAGLLILGVPLAPVLAAVVFIGAFIPVIGAPIATLLAALVALATMGPTTALLVVLLTVIVGSFDGDVLQPLVMGKTVQLHPLAIVSIIAVGAITLGIVGALIAIPIASSVYAVLKYLSGRDPAHPFPPVPAETAEQPSAAA
ncbi:MAG: AI-2E family transporter [Actinomycetia bacterium]|nr:AI-2E family transporter [Actinomycetes bacterium]MCH9800556.1 AI-2E family transporter [Actinomycetes bacterium]